MVIWTSHGGGWDLNKKSGPNTFGNFLPPQVKFIHIFHFRHVINVASFLTPLGPQTTIIVIFSSSSSSLRFEATTSALIQSLRLGFLCSQQTWALFIIYYFESLQVGVEKGWTFSTAVAPNLIFFAHLTCKVLGDTLKKNKIVKYVWQLNTYVKKKREDSC